MATAIRDETTGTLPVVSVARLEVSTALLDAIMQRETSMFALRGQEYARVWSERSERPIRHDEVAQIAGALGAALGRSDVPELLAEVQSAGLLTRHDPPRTEVLLAAGLATAPAFITACLDFVALIEMDTETFIEAYESGTMDETIAEHVRELRKLDLPEARARAERAFQHLSAQSGSSPGKSSG